MLPEQQQRILGYFIEEAKDHLNTIEQGLLNLQATIVNPEMANEVFRAAHSVKGGAAMLGIESMQRTAHRMEDYFKLLKDATIRVDRPLESMFLRVFDALQELLEQLQGPFGLTEDKEQSIMTGIEPVFQQLQEHLDQLVADADTNEVLEEVAPVAFTAPSPQPVEESALKLVFSSDVSAALREMLARFKQADTDSSRSALEACCQMLERFGEQFNLPSWMNLVKHGRWAVCDRNNDYRTLAPVLIKEIKKAQDLVLAGREPDISLSQTLQALAAQGDTIDDANDFNVLFVDEPLLTTSEPDNIPVNQNLDELSSLESEPHLEGREDVFSSDADDDISLDNLLNDAATTPSGPEVGAAELTSLADLFEAGGDDLDSTWQEEEVPITESVSPAESLDIEISPDFEDLLNDDSADLEANLNDFESGSELADLFGDADNTADDLTDFDNTLELTPSSETTTGSESSPESFDGLFDDITDDIAPNHQADSVDSLFNGSEQSSREVNPDQDSLERSDGLDALDELSSSIEHDSADIDLEFESADLFADSEALLDTNPDISTPAMDEGFFDIEETSQSSDSSSAETAQSEFDDFFALDKSNESAGDSLDSLESDDLWADNNDTDTAPAGSPLEDLSADIWTDSPSEQSLEQESLDSASLDPVSIESNDLPQSIDADALDEDIWASIEAIDENPSATDSETGNSSSAELDSLFDEESSPELADSLAQSEETSNFSLDSDLFYLFVQSDELSETADDLSIETADSSADGGLDDLFANETPELADDLSAEGELDDLFGQTSETAASTTDTEQSASINVSLEQETDGLDDIMLTDTAESDDNLDELFGDLSTENESGMEGIDSVLDELEFAPPETSELPDLDVNQSEQGENDSTEDDIAASILNEPPSNDIEFDLLDLEDSGIVTGFVTDDSRLDSNVENNLLDTTDINLLSGPEDDLLSSDSVLDSAEAPNIENSGLDDLNLEESLTDSALDSLGDGESLTAVTVDVSELLTPLDTTDAASDDQDLDALDSLLSDMPAESDSTPASDQDGEFGDLEALLDSPDPSASPTVSSAPSADLDDEFGDLEALLQDADQTLTPTAASSISYRPTSNRLSSRRLATNQTMRVSVGHLDNLSNLVGELVVNRNTLEQDQERLRQFLDNLLFQVQQLNDVGQRMRDLYERSLLESSLISSRQSYQMSSGGTRIETDRSDHATGESFDALEMDRFTGFHTLSQEMIELIVRVRESTSDIAYTVESSDQVTRQFRQVTNQLQEGLNKARMVPFNQTASRLPRAVRDISVKCGKEARLVVEGRDILIDKMILEQLYDPMTHLVNNAITHGIETPEERQQAGKSAEGIITVRAFYQGNQTVISVGDDGAGIDPDIVKQKALQKGLISQSDVQTMTVLDVYDLLFHPGFSTRDQADDFAGRGFGMDVVRTSLADIRGNITIDSELGRGTNFTIRLPLTLSISKALSCISNQARIAFPMDGVEDMFDVSRERIQKNDQEQDCIPWRDTLLPFQNLSDLLSFNRTLGRGRVYGGNQDENMISIVVLRSANSFIALEVDQVMGEQEIVIKQLEGPVPKPTGIAGATVLGDGRVMPIADVLELIDLALGRVRRDPTAAVWSQLEEEPPQEDVAKVKSAPTVLIVDDSITVRELLSMSFNKVGYRVEQARDGQEAWEKLRSGLPCDLVFCDIEMPRMDGLELLSRLQKDEGLQQIPIAMLTSRGADRHRQMAVDLGASGYFTKPYLEEALLDAANKMLHGTKLV